MTYSSSQIEELKPNYAVVDTKADATSDKLQFAEQRMKSRNEGQHDGSVGAPPSVGEDVSGQFKRKKGHLKLLPHIG